MILVLGVTVLFALVAAVSTVHALGLWLLLMIAHGLIVSLVGDSAVHLPMLAGLAVTALVLLRVQWSGVAPSTLAIFGGLALLMLVAAMLGIDRGNSVDALTLYGKAFLLAVLLAGCLKDERALRTMTLYCLAGMLFGAAIAVYQKVTGHYTVDTIYVRRAGGLRGDPNDTAMLLVAGVPLALYWLGRSRHMAMKAACALGALLLIFGVVLTESRGGFVALAFVSVLLYARRPTPAATLLGLVLIGAVAAMAPHSYWHRLDSLVTGKESHGARSLQQRAELQREGLMILIDHPIHGVGPGNFGESYAAAMAASVPLFGHTIARHAGGDIVAHDMYLEFFVENGLAGGVLLLAVFWSAVIGLLRYDRTRNDRSGLGLGTALAFSLMGMMFAGMFLSEGKNSVLWFLVGMGLAAGQLALAQGRLIWTERARPAFPNLVDAPPEAGRG